MHESDELISLYELIIQLMDKTIGPSEATYLVLLLMYISEIFFLKQYKIENEIDLFFC